MSLWAQAPSRGPGVVRTPWWALGHHRDLDPGGHGDPWRALHAPPRPHASSPISLSLPHVPEMISRCEGPCVSRQGLWDQTHARDRGAPREPPSSLPIR